MSKDISPSHENTDVFQNLQQKSYKRRNSHIEQKSRLFQDSVHGAIKIDPLLVAITDTPQFQRLRDLKQLAGVYWVFPGACHNRFEHCIGTSYLCGLMLETLKELHNTEYDNAVEITETEILCVKIAGLCHDLGHGPFSHTFDRSFIKRVRPDTKWTHEQGSCDLFDYMLAVNEGLREMLTERGIRENECELIKRMIKGEQILSTEKGFLYEIVSNKRTGIDCDKLDYFARDTHHLGMKNTFNIQRFFHNIRILSVDGQLQVCVRDKEMFSLYELFHVRWALHHQVYQHKTTRIIEEMICEAMLKVDNKYGISAAIDNMESYTNLTDSIIYDILRSNDDDQDLKDAQELIKRIQKRDFMMYFCARINSSSTKRESDELQEDMIAQAIIDTSYGALEREDLFVDIISIGYGMKDQNPVEEVIFFTKDGKPIKLRREYLSDILPNSFFEKLIRVYCTKREKKQEVKNNFESWCRKKGYLIPNTLEGDTAGYFTNVCKSKDSAIFMKKK
ncbi:deoxynucleoside triphosphate triphosphohydrolase SAMHD1-like [Hydractinia symbiolongicarpus]|uniref:deoxynucleoside triphosphate triphosphohydrolase SAMHD1-like n=1 Tax=Hydractinia symbiolongicarpus TaxID=13093 RepID=UPI00254EB313|nr:deoxynucleoside triphosphate triphosphohydrolase SAMHD1-like [Hydractinia symbiolongicarpus]XP_057289718.1 deoxynucleoside triphosphate triphosphohydrolase SAMHD1-like [Hydractinia symbiolongicarpus]XP_057289719.1 deoxynucleoside triphosphate triphosphohydrolase SAMHD1-like [Hydractinia symbiolongicarpus]XP_057289720.1 deoxynucleoside triphosphate triphosphohydrolase SAMHD1-like [Hydractinia symbiolongicarpus]XP_057289721.1 deoxynucleoside triphosphate triphosphohydrolase SAMHD1-like [Hydrac